MATSAVRWHLGEPMDRGAVAEFRRRGYGGGPDEFAKVFDLIATAAKGLGAELAAMFGGAGDG